MKINHKTIPWSRPYLTEKERTALLSAFDSGWISAGHYVEEFEGSLNALHQSPYGLCVSSGTAALNLSLQVLSLKNTDEVIVPGYCFAAAANAVLRSGAKPVFADVDPQTWCLTADEIDRRITPQTRAVITVHNYGVVSDIENIAELCRRNNIVLIEDAAEAIFSRWNDRYAGTFGDMSVFSFQAAKTITTGEGGYIAVKDQEYYNLMRLWRSHGMDEAQKYFHKCPGDNFRMTDLQAAIGTAQLKNSAWIVEEKKKVYRIYQQLFQGWEGVALQGFESQCDPLAWTVAVKMDPHVFSQGRGWLMYQLLEKGIETRPGFSSFREMGFYHAPFLNHSENLSASVVCLPSYCGLKEDEIAYICETMKLRAGAAV